MLENKVKKALKNDQPVFGMGMTAPYDIPALRVLANSGVEWFFLDVEHSPADVGELYTAVQFLDLAGLCSVPRIPNLEYPWIARTLDMGASGVMVPRIETKEQAELAVQWAKLPPQGIRGMGSPSYIGFAPVSIAEGIEIANRETLIVLQIETVKAVENVEAIASVPGVDVLFIGPLDLSISLGKPGDVASEESHQLFRRVCHVARAKGLAVGVVCQANQVKLYYDMGIRMFSVGSPFSHMRAGVQAAATEFHRQLAK
jgi:2-keto-3-deoxy-L-rhamnonate aldolase RhmA